jgi:surfeit locus 1 family protein
LAFRPTLWPTLFTVPALIMLVALGSWQIQRLNWKQDLIAKLQSRSVGTAVAPPAAGADLDAFEFQRVAVTGVFRHDHEFYLIGRARNGEPGVHILTPLAPDDGSAAVLVDRGWAPFERREPASRPGGQVTGSVTVSGIVRLQKPPGYFTPENELKHNTWYFVDVAGMGKAAGMSLRPGYYIVSDKVDLPGGLPKGGQWRLDLRNDHLSYALTWYGLAIALLVIYVLYHRRKT